MKVLKQHYFDVFSHKKIAFLKKLLLFSVLLLYSPVVLTSPIRAQMASPLMTSQIYLPVIRQIGSPFGVFPNCIAPAIGIEDHSWWHEPGEATPRHVHIAACVPNARDTTGDVLSVSGELHITARVILFNTPGKLNWIQAGIFESTDDSAGASGPCPGTPLACHQFDPPFQCQTYPDEEKECTLYVQMLIPTQAAPHAGLVELRMRPNVSHVDLDARQFPTLNFQIYVRDGRSETNYRNSPVPIIRSWYTDMEYAIFSLENYIVLLGDDLSKSVPTVSGIVPLKVKHGGGTFVQTSKLFLDPDFHHHHPGTQLYEVPGLFVGTFNWDSRTVPNGIHTLYFQTEDKRTDDGGVNAGAMALQVNVQN
ncbi:MAG TPA: hypothetical protein VF177_09305 [Anaerolineae bacterium]